MVCTILCAADLWGVKVNYELVFPTIPTFPELQARIDTVFNTEHALRRPADVPVSQVFEVERMQVFEERSQQWVDLIAPTQLQEFAQIYLFQRETDFHKEVQSKIPPPCPAPVSGYSPVLTTPPIIAPAPPVAPPAPVEPTPAERAAAFSTLAGRTVSTSDKQATVFDEFDERKVRVIEDEVFKTALTRLRIEYTLASNTDIFKKADINNDGVISYDEWIRFTELFPTLLDSLYFRSKDYWTDVHQQQEIAAAKTRLEELEGKELDARAETRKSQGETANQDLKLSQQRAAVEEAKAREERSKQSLDDCQRDTEGARNTLRDRMVELNGQKEKERQKHAAVAEAVREVELANRKLAVQENEASKAEDILRELERRVAEQRKELERRQQEVERASSDVRSAKSEEQMANITLGEAQKDVQTSAEMVALSEQDLAGKQDRERDAMVSYRESQNDAVKQAATRDVDERELLACKERENAKALFEEDCKKLVGEQEKLVAQLDQINLDLNIKRRQVEDEERPLLEQELKLRQMRETLEEGETRLRSDQRMFHTNHGRGETAADCSTSPIHPASPARQAVVSALGVNTTVSPYRGYTASVLPPASATSIAAAGYASALHAPALAMLPPPATGGVSPAL